MSLFTRVWKAVRSVFARAGFVRTKPANDGSTHSSIYNARVKERMENVQETQRKSSETSLKDTGFSGMSTHQSNRNSVEVHLRDYYNRAIDPEVTFNVFYLRVVSFGWGKVEALYIQSRGQDRQCKVFYNGKEYTLKEIYDNCLDPKVNYNAFYARVSVRGWDVDSALYTDARR